LTRKHMRGGERVEKLFVQSKFAGEYERLMQEENGDEVRFMRDCELEEARKRPLVTRSHPVRTDEELRESFERGFVHEKRDGSRRLLAAARERYGTNDMDEAFEKYKQEHLELHRQHEKIRSLEKFLRENATQISKSRQSQSTYYYYKGTTYRFSDHVYPTGSMTRRWPDGTFDKVDLTVEPYLIDEVAREVDGKVVPLSTEAEEGGVRFSFAKSKEEFDTVRDRAVEENGIAMPGLNDKEIKVVNVEKMEDGKLHPFDLTLKETEKKRKIEEYAVNNGLTGDVYVEGGIVQISKSSIGSFVDDKHIQKSKKMGVPADVHVAAVLRIKDIIGNSVDVEIYPERNVKASDGTRNIKDGYAHNTVMHVLYGVSNIDGKDYSVRTLVKEQRGKGSNSAYVYSLEEIELSDGHNEAANSELSRKSDRTIPLAKIIQNVGKTMEPGKLLLEESAKEDRNRERQNTQNGSGGGRAKFMVSGESDADYMDAVEKGDAEKAGEMVREAAKRAMPETKVLDENGEPRVMYHGTNLTRVNGSMPFWVFNEDSHFGTREQAEDAFGRSQRRKELSKIYSVYLDIRNPKSTADESRIPRMPMRKTLLNIW